MNLFQLKSLFVKAGCTRLYAKPLAENDNSKNQVYFGPDFQALNLFPNTGVFSESSTKNPIFKAKLNFGWLLVNGEVVEAPGAQLILYPQYPEVRFSGFLKGCVAAPSELMASRLLGRVLFLGVTADRRVVGFVVCADSHIACEFRDEISEPPIGIFFEISLPQITGDEDSRSLLLAELGRIHRLGWIEAKQLDSDGQLKPCRAPQCGGFTLEAELGVAKNSLSEPDFFGWEIKQHAVTNFKSLGAGAITLMTPEPTGGFYKDHGVEAFVRKFGYADKHDRLDRINFGGVHRVGRRHSTTCLTMQLQGYDAIRGRITQADGCVALVDDAGDVAANWAFSGLLAHWSRKHSKAAYVPSQCRHEAQLKYAYGSRVRLAQRTDSLRLLNALAAGTVYYDPGIKVENASTWPRTKRRSQFRIASRDMADLYETLDLVDV